MTRWLIFTALYLAFSSVTRAQSLLSEITSEGIAFSDDQRILLPPPVWGDELTVEQRAKAKEQLAGNDGWERFARDSVVAPVTIKLAYINNKNGKRVGHNIHSAFVVYAKLDTLGEEELMQQIFGKSDANGLSRRELNESDLVAAGIPAAAATESLKHGYSMIEFTLLDKIRLQGVIRSEVNQQPKATTIAWMLDPRFDSDKQFRGLWTRLEEDKSTEPQPYQGWGGYMRVTQMEDSADQLLIESRMVLHELPEWFHASNFIRSKLPLAIQEGARNMRRKLKGTSN